MIHDVLVAASIDHEGDQLADCVVCNVPERGQTIAGNSHEGGLAIDPGRGLSSTVGLPLTSPTPSRVYKCARQPAAAEYSRRQHSALPSPPPSGELALQEILALMPARLLPPYPCVGHQSPPSPSTASFRRASSSERLHRSPPWPSIGPAGRCLW